MSTESTSLLEQEYSTEAAAAPHSRPVIRRAATPARVDVQVLTPSPKWWVSTLQTSLQAMRTRWFWYAVASSLCWTAWAFTARAGSREISPAGMQFVSAFGFLLVGLTLVATNQFQWRASARGIGNALVSGVLLGAGGLALYAAYRSGQNASVITALTSVYPVVTVMMARIFLREKLNRRQICGVCCALVAIVLLSS